MNTRNNPNNNKEIPKMKTMGRKYDFKKVDITLWHGFFPESCLDIVTNYSFCFENSAKKSPLTKIDCLYGKLP